uniref:Uncharacterized protein n=1 Tax=Arundo donax TaxID=35708 RepID=A0A0A9BZF4_ARUDO
MSTSYFQRLNLDHQEMKKSIRVGMDLHSMPVWGRRGRRGRQREEGERCSCGGRVP